MISAVWVPILQVGLAQKATGGSISPPGYHLPAP